MRQSAARHRRLFQIAAQVFRRLPRVLRRFSEIDVPVILSLLVFPLAENEPFPLIIIPEVGKRRRQRQETPCFKQELADVPHPAFPDLRQVKAHRFSVSVGINPVGGPRQVNMAVPVKLAAVGMQGAKIAPFPMEA